MTEPIKINNIKESIMTKKLPDAVMKAWQEREGPLVLITVSENGIPNAIYASIVKIIADGRIAIADNYFDKTKVNIEKGTVGSLLFITKNRKAYQVKGPIEYYIEGPFYEEMLSWADPKYPRKGVAIVNTETIFKGKEKLL